jgi:hypothetical protein
MKEFEKEIIFALLANSECSDIALPLAENQTTFEFTGAGYFISFENDQLPKHRVVLDKPVITGRLGEVDVGYIAFIENSELILECYTLSEGITEESRENEFVQSAT